MWDIMREPMDTERIKKQREKKLLEKLEVKPDDVALRVEYAYYLAREERHDEAEKQFEIAMEGAAGNPDVVAMYSRYLMSRGRKDQAEDMISSALAKNPMESILLKAHGLALYSIGEFEEALDELNSARQTSGDDPSIDYQIIECYIALGEYDAAIDTARAAAEQYAEDPVRKHSLGRAYWAAEMFEQSETALREAAKLDPRSLNILLDLVGVLSEMEDYDIALDLMMAGEQNFSASAEFHYVLGNLYSDKSEIDKARGSYLKAITLNPRHYHSLNNLALIMQDKNGTTEEVEKLFQQALEVNPEDVYANYNYGNYLLNKGRREEALPHYKMVIDHEPNYIQARINYGQTLLELSRREDAMAELASILTLPDVSAEDEASVARLYLQAGEEEEGERLLKRAVRDSQGRSLFPLEYLGDFLYNRGRFEESTECYLRAVMLESGDTTVWMKALGTLLENRTRPGFLFHVREFAQVKLPATYGILPDDEVLKAVIVFLDAMETGDISLLTGYGEAASRTKNPALLAVIAKLKAELGDAGGAEEAFELATSAAPHDISIVREYIGLLIERKEYDKAHAVIDKAIADNPDEPMLENDLGLVLYSLAKKERAREVFYGLSRRFPLEATYIYNYAWILSQDGLRDIAISVLEGYLDNVSFDEENAYFLSQLISDKRERHLFAKAETLLRQVLSSNPENTSAWTLLSWLESERGDFDSARFSMNQAIELSPDDPAVLLSAATFYMSILQFSTAAKYIEECEKLRPDDEEVVMEKARLFQAAGMYEASVRPMKTLFMKSPVEYGFQMACTLHHLGRVEEAEQIASGLQDKPSNRSGSIARGWYLFLRGDTDGAIKETMAGMAEWAEIVDFRNLSIFLLAAGRFTEAQESIKIFLANATQPLDVYFFIQDITDYKARFNEAQADEFHMALAMKLKDMIGRIKQTGQPA